MLENLRDPGAADGGRRAAHGRRTELRNGLCHFLSVPLLVVGVEHTVRVADELQSGPFRRTAAGRGHTD